MTATAVDLTQTHDGRALVEAGAGGIGVLTLTGNWTLGADLPDADVIMAQIGPREGLTQLKIDSTELTGWDSMLLTSVLRVMEHAKARDIAVDPAGLPEAAQRLIALATAVPERQGARRSETQDGLLERIGQSWIDWYKSCQETVGFIGEASIALARFCFGKARFRHVDLMIALQECGPKALPIVTLISLLIGLILAFVGAIQLRQFGAQIFVADLVAIAMAREMAAIMTGIIMAGRTGAAFAAQLGTMQVNEEIDAFRTLGFSPMEFLVLPRMLALILMMPLLTIYANLLGILGGGLVGVVMLDLTPTAYYVQTIAAVGLTDFAIGIFKGLVFGIVVALTGCLKGIQSGRSASAVGNAATSAVVVSIVLIVVIDGLFALITSLLGI